MSTEQFVAALTDYQLAPTEIADILWLALRQPQVEALSQADNDSRDEDDAGQADGVDHDTRDPRDGTDLDTGDREGGTDEDSGKADENASFDLAPAFPAGILPKKALPISVPDAGILDETLPLVRAMKPLLRQLESQMVSTVNEVETVDRIAETDIWSPVLDPEREPWFEVALVIDSSPAMKIWQRLIQDIQRLLRCYGSFRDFRVWQLAVTNGEVGICAVSDPEAVPRSPSALLPPDARRLILVFSDCTANYWWDGSLQPVLALWGESTPTAVWQVLPDWMWKRTALGIGEYVAVRNHIPGASNIKLTPIFLSLRSVARRGSKGATQEADSDPLPLLPAPICIPVVTSEGTSLDAWSRMLAGDRRYSTPGFVLPPTGWQPTAPPEPEDSDQEGIADDLLETFRLRATPSARRLAALLSAAPVITLPVMRLIRSSDELLPGSSPLPVAEVFLSGLLKKAPDQPDAADPELVQYTFPDQVRDRLLDVLPKVDAIEVIEAVSRYIAERLNCTMADFRALLLSPDLKAEADQYGLRSFAKMTAQILRKVGPEFDELVRQLEDTGENGDSGSGADADNGDWLAGFTHATLTYQVAEYINFPALESFTFDQAELVEDELIEEDTSTFPPPLETDTFTVITFEAQPQGPQLEPFDFTIATLIKRGTGWVVERGESSAERFIERLPGDISLEMVSIPGGSFLMGASKNEPERDASRENPQHEVTVQPFFIGRYPITQAQWQVVAAMPQVERELNPDPSSFKGNDRPVERVNWHKAVEFCRRLSQHTGRDYRLPSEAEWEYACRAGTDTPYHFGQQLTREVANIRGHATTEVGSFGVTNAFGLYDMHGNVWEWCQDVWHGNYRGAPTDGSAWVEGGDQSRRIIRGGAWNSDPRNCRSAYRLRNVPGFHVNNIGFRVCCCFDYAQHKSAP